MKNNIKKVHYVRGNCNLEQKVITRLCADTGTKELFAVSGRYSDGHIAYSKIVVAPDGSYDVFPSDDTTYIQLVPFGGTHLIMYRFHTI